MCRKVSHFASLQRMPVSPVQSLRLPNSNIFCSAIPSYRKKNEKNEQSRPLDRPGRKRTEVREGENSGRADRRLKDSFESVDSNY